MCIFAVSIDLFRYSENRFCWSPFLAQLLAASYAGLRALSTAADLVVHVLPGSAQAAISRRIAELFTILAKATEDLLERHRRCQCLMKHQWNCVEAESQLSFRVPSIGRALQGLWAVGAFDAVAQGMLVWAD